MLSDQLGLKLVRIGFGLLCLAKAYDFWERLPPRAGTGGWVIVTIWIASAAAVTTGRGARVGLAGLIVAGVASFTHPDGIYNQHIFLIVSIAAALLLVDGRQRWLLLKAQLTIVYAFAAITKLNYGFLSGGRLENTMVDRPAWDRLGLDRFDIELVLPVMAVLAVTTEAWLAVGLWSHRTRHVTTMLGVSFHAVMTLMMTAANWASAVRLVVFSALMMLLYLAFYVRDDERSTVPQAATLSPATAHRSGSSTSDGADG